MSVRAKPLLRDLRCTARSSGRPAALRWLLSSAFRVVWWFEDELVLSKALAVDPLASRVRVVWAESRHLPLLTELDRRRCRSRAIGRHGDLRRGREAMLGFVGDELIGHLWWMDRGRAANHYDVKQLGLELREHDVYVFDMFVAPEHRGDDVASQFLRSSCDELARLGYRRAWGSVLRQNVAAAWLYRTNGWEVVRRSRSVRLLSMLLATDGRLYLKRRRSWTRLR